MSAHYIFRKRIIKFGVALMTPLTLSGCFVFPNNQATFTTKTQVFLDASDTTPFLVLPRPYQPIMGTLTSTNGNAPTAPNTAESFGSTSGAYGVYTDNTGTKTVDYLASGSWNVLYNWLPEPQGCFSPNGVPGPTTASGGDWNVTSAPYMSYEPSNPNNPLSIAYTNNGNGTVSYNAPTFFCNMVAIDIAGSDAPQVTLGTPPTYLTVTFMNQFLSPLSTYTLGSPITLMVFDATGTQIQPPVQDNAVSLPTAYSAKFNFPTDASGNALTTGIYGTIVSGQDAFGNTNYLGGEGYFFIGSANPNLARTPFGVAVQDLSEVITECFTSPNMENSNITASKNTANSQISETEASPNFQLPPGPHCTTGDVQTSSPVVTSLTDNTLTTATGVIAVGQMPVAVLTYGTAPGSTTTFENPGGGVSSITRETDIDGTGYALVVNNGSDNVSIINLVDLTTVATVAVGNGPVAAAIDPTSSYAYIANYSDSTITEISLSTYSVINSFAVGSNPTALSIDSTGNIWVGGNGYISEYNPQNYALITTSPVNGIINSLALSATQGQVVSSTVQPASPSIPHATAAVASAAFSSPAVQTSSVTAIADPYASSSVATSLATPYLLGGGTVISANYRNNLSVSATPTGFIVQDVHTGDVLVSATTSAPIRAIAVDQNFGFAYMTIPDSNTVITFPLPGSAQ